jgi:hypothetical protein
MDGMAKAKHKERAQASAEEAGRVIYPRQFAKDDHAILEGLRAGLTSSREALYDKDVARVAPQALGALVWTMGRDRTIGPIGRTGRRGLSLLFRC